MKDTHTGTVCNCYVSFHEPSNRIITMPVDAIKIPDYIYSKRLDDKQKQILASGDRLPINDIQRKNDTLLSGVAFVDPRIMDIAFKQSGEQLKVNDTIMGTKITPEQKKMLQNHEMVFFQFMKPCNNGIYIHYIHICYGFNPRLFERPLLLLFSNYHCPLQ